MPRFLSAGAVARALTLRERLDLRAAAHAAAAQAAATADPGAPAEDPAAAKMLDAWRSREPFLDPLWWQARLRSDGIDETTLLHVIGAPTDPSVLPDWVVELATAYEVHEAADPPHRLGDGTGDNVHFVPFVAPLLASARTRLAALLRRHEWPADIDPDVVLEELYRPLPELLSRMVNRTMALEVNAARLAGRLAGDTTAERFAAFVADLRQPARRAGLLERYPVLGRQLVVAIGTWVEAADELATRLCADHPSILALLAGADADGGTPGRLTTIATDLGDRHRGGRTVARLGWESGAQVMYKPRSVAVDGCFQRLMGWLNTKGVRYPFRQLRYVEGDGYGWAEFVTPRPCADEASLRRFYHRQGGLLGVLHVLRATDFHAENIIAGGDQPVLVDLESLVQPSLPADDDVTTAAEAAAIELSFGSVLRIGLLPFRTWNSGGRAIDISGIGAVPGQRSPIGMPVLTGAGTDTMRVTLERDLIDSQSNRPVVDSTPLRLLDYADDLVAGFTEAYETIRAHRDELLSEGGALHAFGRAEVRVIPRGTLLYTAIRQTGFHPDLLGEALRRDAHFDCLWRTVPQQPALAALVNAERRDLWRNDVPVFTARADSEVLHDSTGAPVSGIQVRSGMDRVREAVDGLGPDDLDRQHWLIRGALGTTVIDASRELTNPPYPVDRNAEPADRNRLVAAAAAVGDQLTRIAVDTPDSAQWLGVNSDRGRNWGLGPLGPDLFNGLAGVALFLAQLGAATGEGRYSALARRAVTTIRAQLDRAAPDIGGMAGLGGLSWTMCHLGRLWGDGTLLDAAVTLAERLGPLIATDVEYDVVSGAAGTILSLRALHQARPDGPAADLIRRTADHLVAAACPVEPHGVGWLAESMLEGGWASVPMAGFAHGQAGAALALLEAAALLGEDRYRQTARDAIAYERTLFDQGTGTWRDVRIPEPGFEDLQVVAWCHGAPGIGLARALSRPHLPEDPEIPGEIDSAVRVTRRTGFGASHCLCHGDLGNVELFRHAAGALGRPDLRAEADRLVAGLLDGFDRNGWSCGVPLAVQTPSMLVGLAGIGYGLLRAADPDRVPAVLTLDPGPA